MACQRLAHLEGKFMKDLGVSEAIVRGDRKAITVWLKGLSKLDQRILWANLNHVESQQELPRVAPSHPAALE